MGSKVLIGAGLAAIAVALMWMLVGSMGAPSERFTVGVRRGEFVVCVEATGKLESGNAARVEARPRGKVLTYLAGEGLLVKKDEVLARFDDTELRERVVTQQNDLKMSEARLAESREQMAVRRQEIDAQVTMLEADLAIRRTQYERLQSLPYPDDVTRAKLERDYRKSRLEIARQDLEILQSLAAKGAMVFSKEEMREKELAYTDSQGELEKAENALEQVMSGALPTDLDAAKRDLAKAQIDLAEAKQRLPQQITILEANVHSAEAEVDKMKTRLERTQKDLDDLEVKAPRDGMLVYRTLRGQPLQLGDQIWHQAHLFDIADLDNNIVRAKVSESEFSLIRPGQPVEIRAYSVPDRVFKGVVKEVAKVATDKTEGDVLLRRGGQEKAGIQAFDVFCSITEPSIYLRPNVEAEVVISCDRIPDALSIPVDAVFERDGKKWVQVVTGSRVKPREVKLGVMGGDWVQVTEGLKAGERVLLTRQDAEGR